MAIKGLTDNREAFPIIGVLRKGEAKDPDKNAPGKDLTYFRFVTDDELAAEMFHKAYPNQEKLRNINIFLPYKTTEENFIDGSWIEKWVASSLVYRSDGETMVMWRTPQGALSTEPKPDPKPEILEDGKRADGSMQVGRLSAIIPELGRFVTVTILTTSKWDITNLSRQLRAYESLKGDLRGIPFIVRRRKERISTPAGKGKRARREKWLLSIEMSPEYSMKELSAQEQAALPVGSSIIDTNNYVVHELPAGLSDPVEETATVETESESPQEDSSLAPPVTEEPRPELVEGPAKAPVAMNGVKAEHRPALSPSELKATLEKKVAKTTLVDRETKEPLPVQLHPFGEKTANLVSAKFQEVFKPNPNAEPMYHAALKWLTGKETSNDVSAAWADALLDWLLNGNKDKKWKATIMPPAQEEAYQVYQEALRKAEQEQQDAGQPPVGELDSFFGSKEAVQEEIDSEEDK